MRGRCGKPHPGTLDFFTVLWDIKSMENNETPMAQTAKSAATVNTTDVPQNLDCPRPRIRHRHLDNSDNVVRVYHFMGNEMANELGLFD